MYCINVIKVLDTYWKSLKDKIWQIKTGEAIATGKCRQANVSKNLKVDMPDDNHAKVSSSCGTNTGKLVVGIMARKHERRHCV